MAVQKKENSSNILLRMRPEIRAGGFSRFDGTVEFYSRINALLNANGTVLDFGAGRGASSEDPCRYRRELQSFRGRVVESIGADVDPAVAKNDKVDRHLIVSPDCSLALDDGTIDIVVCDWVFEHLEHPKPIVAELRRVLKSGGWLCARTPNKWGLTSVAARMIPESLHQRALAWLQPRRKTQDVFPASYKLNSRQVLERSLPSSDWDLYIYGWNSDPAYHAESFLIWKVTDLVFHLLPERLSATWHIFAQKK